MTGVQTCVLPIYVEIRLTDDVYDDYNPRFVKNSSQIIFSSNRDGDTIKFGDRKSVV